MVDTIEELRAGCHSKVYSGCGRRREQCLCYQRFDDNIGLQDALATRLVSTLELRLIQTAYSHTSNVPSTGFARLNRILEQHAELHPSNKTP